MHQRLPDSTKSVVLCYNLFCFMAVFRISPHRKLTVAAKIQDMFLQINVGKIGLSTCDENKTS